MKVLISGVAGFIGVHTAEAFLARGAHVIGFDNLSRRGAKENLQWLQSLPGCFEFVHADLRNATDMDVLFARHAGADAVIHLAGQVAVTTSVINPRMDFEANALGTFNVLEAVRRFSPNSAFLFASTNKVYGGMEQLTIVEQDGRYRYQDLSQGVSEDMPLDFHSPYGCSKGTADQYVRDYARIYGLKTVVIRQSCIYGTRQFGVEDQGWVAWFSIASTLGRPMFVYGDGKQVRDVLWIDDLVQFYATVIDKISIAAGQIYNAGGGPTNTLSLLELIAYLREMSNKDLNPAMSDWRPGDQRVFVANIDKARRELGWQPMTTPKEGVKRLLAWVSDERELLSRVLD